MIRFILTLALICGVFASWSQTPEKDSLDVSFLSAQDQARIKSMKEKLSLNEKQNELIPRIFIHYHVLIQEQKEIMNTLAEETSINEEERLKDLNARSEFIKQLRDERDLNVELLLTAEQKEIYLNQIKIAKPQVLHFGVHDRMNCPVCVSPTSAP